MACIRGARTRQRSGRPIAGYSPPSLPFPLPPLPVVGGVLAPVGRGPGVVETAGIWLGPATPSWASTSAAAAPWRPRPRSARSAGVGRPRIDEARPASPPPLPCHRWRPPSSPAPPRGQLGGRGPPHTGRLVTAGHQGEEHHEAEAAPHGRTAFSRFLRARSSPAAKPLSCAGGHVRWAAALPRPSNGSRLDRGGRRRRSARSARPSPRYRRARPAPSRARGA